MQTYIHDTTTAISACSCSSCFSSFFSFCPGSKRQTSRAAEAVGAFLVAEFGVLPVLVVMALTGAAVVEAFGLVNYCFLFASC